MTNLDNRMDYGHFVFDEDNFSLGLPITKGLIYIASYGKDLVQTILENN